jgi:hypothetical protein
LNPDQRAKRAGKSSKKRTAENDDGLLRKDSRDNKTAIELFLAWVRGWEPRIQRHFPWKQGKNTQFG